MPNAAGRSDSALAIPGGKRVVGEDGRVRPSQFSHIIASAIRDVLDIVFLQETFSEPLTPLRVISFRAMTINEGHHTGELTDFLHRASAFRRANRGIVE